MQLCFVVGDDMFLLEKIEEKFAAGLKHRELCEERKPTVDAEVAHELCQNDIPIQMKKAIAHATKG
jgi:hypothetical protein